MTLKAPQRTPFLLIRQHLTGYSRFLLIRQHLTGYSRFLLIRQHLTGYSRSQTVFSRADTFELAAA